MLETAVALVFAHLLADFLLQSDAMARNKARLGYLAGHVAIVATTAWAALGFALLPAAILIVAATHFVIDWCKARFGGPGFGVFALDQAAHLAVLALVAGLYPTAYYDGLWGRPPAGLGSWIERLPEAFAFGAGVVAAVWAGGYAVRALMSPLRLPDEAEGDRSLPQGGKLIGRLERLLILILVLAGELDAIGFLIAAKSILRFSELAREQDRRASEYVIIGTMASFAWGLGAAFLTAAALARLAGP